ncbi:protein translocase subunit SecD [Schaalia vaccimaxillae]|uniref:protein translocase subunit SecD n=1 Tax=Schaalia vaccimaxillae TaxID=183916 RepID=UPI0003B4F03A|nr:protein translocase subunit SecD [Schaalia vaccimaxillae]
MATKKRRPLRSLVFLAVTIAMAAGTLIFGNASKGVSYVPDLALDLQGGTQLILTPTSADSDGRQITEDDIEQAIAIIRNRVDASGVAEAEIASMGTSNIVVSIPGRPSQETLDLIRKSSQMNFRPVLQVGSALTTATTGSEQAPSVDSAASSQAPQSGQTSDDAAQSATQESSESAQSSQSGEQNAQSAPQVQSSAIDEETALTLADRDQDGQLSAEPADAPENASDLGWVTEQVLFDFYTLDCSVAGRTEGTPEQPYAACDANGMYKYILGPVTVPGSDLVAAGAAQVQANGQATGEWGVDLQFNSDGTKAFADSSQILFSFHDSDPEGQTSAFRTPDRNHFAVVLDGVVITSPSMNAVITNGQAQITGSFTASSATALANQLNFGSLPLNFEVESEQQISATLGSDHLRMGLYAGVIGFLLVIVYLIWQYRGLSLIAAGSLLIATLVTYLTITLLSWGMGYRLSLAGVAGLIMAIGVTTDSFIVYFERIRDEVRDGRPLTAAVEEGWDRAKRTILVSDAVNLVAAIVLYMLAVGGVQGFAFTLGVTTVIDLAVIFLFTHPAMEMLIRTKFFGQGHKLSGLDPEKLGAASSLAYAGRGRVVSRGATSASSPSLAGNTSNEDEAAPKSLAERRRQERLAAQAAQSQEEDDASAAETLSSGEDVIESDSQSMDQEGEK